MQVSILSGIYTKAGEYRTSYPRNYVPVPKDQGISDGYLKPADGIVEFGQGPGIGRGGINWKNACYRVMGTKLVCLQANGAYVVIGDVGTGGVARLDYSFDYLSVSNEGRLYLYNGATLTQVTDVDLGSVVDHVWSDGYLVFTDGENIGVTELGDPFSVSPLKYASSEADPDPVVGLLKVRREVYALNRYTIEVFDNTGGDQFPFSPVLGAQIQRGLCGSHAACVYSDAVAFVGSGRNEPPAVWVGANGQTDKLSTREIDTLLEKLSDEQLAAIVLEAKVDKSHNHLLMHLENACWVYDANASGELKRPVWFELTSGLDGSRYRARNHVWVQGSWLVEDPTSSKHGYLSSDVRTHYGDKAAWEFATPIVYNESRGAIFHELELVALPGRVALGDDPVIWTSYSTDGETWSQHRSVKAGRLGETNKRLRWLGQGQMRTQRIQRFRGTTDAQPCIARLEARLEGLDV